jgi:poly(3-hydroxybutyrate) depolymerase
MSKILLLALIVVGATPRIAAAQFALEDFASTQCGADESMFRSGLETAESATSRPSGMKGEAAIGPSSLVVAVPDTGLTHQVLLYVPSTYDGAQAWPLVVALHGAAGSSAQAPTAASSMRSLWSNVAEAQGVIVLAPVASGNSGGWVPSLDTPALACAIAEVERRYDIDRARRYLWGFSAGGHYGHALGLGNSTRFAAYAVNAGVLFALACEPANEDDACEILLPTAARQIPVQLRVGSGDPWAPYVQGDLARLQNAGWSTPATVKKVDFAGGHVVAQSDAQSAWTWFAGHLLPP